MNNNFWRNKSVFITGHTGFKGSWLIIWLEHLGAKITGFALEPDKSNTIYTNGLILNCCKSIIGDVRDLKKLRNSMEEAQPEIVIHMAAQALVKKSYVDPIETYTTNIMGVVNIMEASREIESVKVILNVTTDKCYENNGEIWGFRENEPMGGYDPYSSSKACSEIITASYRKSFFSNKGNSKYQISVATARAGNVIGGGDNATDRLIPDIIKSFKNNQIALIRNPKAIRPWQHVLEPLRGYLMLVEKIYADGQNYAEAWNFGPQVNDEKNVEWIVNEITKLWGGNAKWIQDDIKHAHEAQNLRLDISKANQLLKWKPVLNINESLNMVVEWYKKEEKGQNPKNICLKQIIKYEETIKNLTQI